MSASNPQTWRLFLAGSVLALCLAPALAQQASREQEQLRRVRQQLQELQQQQTAAQDAARRAEADKAAAQTAAKREVDGVQADLRRLRAGQSAQAKAVAEQQQALEALRTERDALKTSADGLGTQLAASQADAARLRSQIAELQASLGQRSSTLSALTDRHQVQAQGLQTCIANNQALHDTGLELLDRYAGKGVADVLAQREPFLQLKRVALENLLQGYQDKLDLLALKPAASAGAEPARAP
jgi:chromosome segregation ATPase